MYETKEERDALFGSYGKYTEVELLNKIATGFGWAVLVRDNFEDNRLKVVKLPNKSETAVELLAEAKILTKISQYLRHRSMEQLVNDLKTCRWPDDAVFTLIEDAKDFQKHGKLVEAYEALDQALLLDPGSPDVHHSRAEIFFLEGETHWALKENETALAIKESAPTWFLQGQCLLARGRTADAAEAFCKGLVLENSSRGRHLLAKCLGNTGQHQEALEQYETALHIAEFVERDQNRVHEIHADLRDLKSKLQP